MASSSLANLSGKAVAIRYMNFAFPVALCLLIFLANLAQPVSAVLTTCYDPSGNVRGDVPCNQGAVQSACCAQGWVCTNISLCVAGPTVKLNPGDPEQFEGSCTDKTWNSPFCPSFCRTGNLSQNAANGMWNCTKGDWCCSAFGGDEDCCERGTDVFFLGDYVNITTIGGANGPGFSTSTSTQSSTSLPATTTTTKTTTMTSASSSTTALPVTSTSFSTTPTPTSIPQDSGGSSLGTGAKVGIAIGAVAAVAALGLLGFFLYRQRNKNKELKEQMELLQQNPGQKGSGDQLMGANPSAYATKHQYYRDNVEPAPVYEIDGGFEPAEFDARREVSEADANREIGELPYNARR